MSIASLKSSILQYQTPKTIPNCQKVSHK